MPRPAQTLPATSPARVDFETQPGHLIRRLHQIAVALFLQETEPHGITPVQFAALSAVGATPGIDQRTLARTIGLDTSTTAGVVDRLQARGLLERRTTPHDRRVRLLHLTDDGASALQRIHPDMLRAQQRILAPLPPAAQAQFLALLGTLVAANNEHSRAPEA